MSDYIISNNIETIFFNRLIFKISEIISILINHSLNYKQWKILKQKNIDFIPSKYFGAQKRLLFYVFLHIYYYLHIFLRYSTDYSLEMDFWVSLISSFVMVYWLTRSKCLPMKMDNPSFFICPYH